MPIITLFHVEFYKCSNEILSCILSQNIGNYGLRPLARVRQTPSPQKRINKAVHSRGIFGYTFRLFRYLKNEDVDR